MFPTLQHFLAHLEARGELRRIAAPVSPILEISEIADRMAKSPAPSIGATGPATDPEFAGLGGPALLFENVEGSPFPLAINVFGSYRRMELALGCPDGTGFAHIADRIASLTKPAPPASFAEVISKAREFLPLLRTPPRKVRRGLCQEVVRTGTEINLLEWPFLKCWPLDGDPASVGFPLPPDQIDTSPGQGRFITFAGIYTIHADDRDRPRPTSRNIGMYRLQVINRTTLAMHWHIHHDGAAHWRSWKALGRPMPVAIVFGGESVLPYAATCPLPPGISELLMAGFLNGRGIPLVRAHSVPLDVPANAELIIEGFVNTQCGPIGFDPRVPDAEGNTRVLGPGAVLEGPFGDHTGFYSLPDRYPLVEVTAITHRTRPVIPATIVGYPPQEDYYLGKATERIMLPLLRTLIHDIEDYHLPLFGCFHNCAFLRIHKAYPLQARRVMHAVWGAGQMAWTKLIVVVDHDVEVHRLDAVLRALFATAAFPESLEVVRGPLDILDHAAPVVGAGTKMGLDATRPFPGDRPADLPPPVFLDTPAQSRYIESARRAFPDLADIVFPEAMLGRGALISTASTDPEVNREMLERLVSLPDHASPQFILLLPVEADLGDLHNALFHFAANTDPGRDAVTSSAHAAIAFDATAKVSSRPGYRPYPPPMQMPDEIRDRVTRRWAEYGFPA